MGEAMLFPGGVTAAQEVQLGPLRFAARGAPAAGEVKIAVRPEAWQVGPPGSGLPGRLAKCAYLGNSYEYTFETELGQVFVVSSDLDRALPPGVDVGLSLATHGVSVIAA
jgi:iron(III) transport system ATP-binding protein